MASGAASAVKLFRTLHALSESSREPNYIYILDFLVETEGVYHGVWRRLSVTVGLAKGLVAPAASGHTAGGAWWVMCMDSVHGEGRGRRRKR